MTVSELPLPNSTVDNFLLYLIYHSTYSHTSLSIEIKLQAGHFYAFQQSSSNHENIVLHNRKKFSKVFNMI